MRSTRDVVKGELERRPTAELISILRNQDETEWQPEVFDLVAELLEARGVSTAQVVALGPEGRDLVESEPTATVATFFNPVQAHIPRAALEGAGISAWVTDEALGSMYGVGIGSRLQVRVADVERAREVLGGLAVPAGALPAELAEPPCPACGSRNVVSEAWVNDASRAEPNRRDDRRNWYFVCSDCREAWPMDGEEGP